ncbi:MAG: putative toxin-antitoxin system toxin component, PIN family [Bacteroidales bacterium]|nr:putative toxin-antitoxin system toxin component, PIN family [Bacteroidales bacterium]
MEKNNIYAVIDTNVIVSALLSHNIQSSTYIVFDAILNGKITPIYNEDILNEYLEVLSRDKFPFQKEDIDMVATLITRSGLKLERTKVIDEIFPDPKNIVFYEVAMSKDDAYLVTGNIKHFPKKPFVVTPAEMVEILNL